MLLPREHLSGESEVPRILIGTILPQTLAFFFLLGRVVTRVLVVGKWAWDDTLIIIAWIFSLMTTVLVDISTIFGHGHHIESVPPELILESFKISFLTLIAYQLALIFTRFSILAFYLRVFPSRREQWLAWGTIVFVAISSVPILAVSILLFSPRSDEPSRSTRGMCLQVRPVLIVSSILHMTIDGWMILMVIPVVSALKIPRKQKWAIMGIFGLGFFVILASIARFAVLLGTDENGDITWSIAGFEILSVLETSVSIMCACAPTIRPLLHKFFPTLMVHHSASGTVKSRLNALPGRPTMPSVASDSATNISIPASTLPRRKGDWTSDESERRLIVDEAVAARTNDFNFFSKSPLLRPLSIGAGGRASIAGKQEDPLKEGSTHHVATDHFLICDSWMHGIGML